VKSKYFEHGPYACVNHLLLTGRQLVPHSRVRLGQPLFLVFKAVLNPPSVIVLHAQMIQQMRALQRDKKPSFATKKKINVSHCYSSKDPGVELQEPAWAASARGAPLPGPVGPARGQLVVGTRFLSCRPQPVLLANPILSGFLLCCFSPFGCAYAVRAGGFVGWGFCLMGDPWALIFTEGAKHLASDF